MCLEEVDGAQGTVRSGGVRLQVRLDLVPDAATGDWVLVHAGYAIAAIDEAEAAETLALLRQVAAEIRWDDR
jgi:hydrogenase expression/formation protein HypC